MIAIAFASPAHAACPIELAIYGDRDRVASVEFTPTQGAMAVPNTFRMLLGKDIVLDGIVMWTEEISRPNGMLMLKCPEGDVTGEELSACTLWQGVIYAADDKGVVELLPGEGAAAPKTLIFPDLGPSLRGSASYGPDGISMLPFDVFALQGCQE